MEKVQIVATFIVDDEGTGKIHIEQDDLDKLVLLRGGTKTPTPI